MAARLPSSERPGPDRSTSARTSSGSRTSAAGSRTRTAGARTAASAAAPAASSSARARRPAAGRPRTKPLTGCPVPRLWTRPLRRLTRTTTRGYEVIDFARNVLGEPLLPWQEWLVIHALELLPDSTFRFRTVIAMVARQNGKTSLSRTLALWRLYVDGARLVLGAAQDVSIAREVLTAATDMAQSVPDLAAEIDVVRRTNGDEYLKLVGGGRYKITASTRSAGRGLSVDHLTMDEIREQRDWAAWSALSKTTIARPHSQIWALSNAGDHQSVVLNHLRDAALSERDASIGVFEWSAPDGCALDDPAAWTQANPALGHTISETAIRGALATDPPDVFRTEVLCQRIDALNSAIDLAAWRACADPAGTMTDLRDRVIVCLDVAPDGGHVTLVAAADTPDGRVRVEPVAAWTSTEDARRDLPDLLARVNPAGIAWFPGGPAAVLAPELRGGTWGEAYGITGAEVAEACQGIADLVASRRIVHPMDPLLDAHVAGATKFHVGDGWRFVRRGAGHVDAAYAAAGAVHHLRTRPDEIPQPRSAVY